MIKSMVMASGVLPMDRGRQDASEALRPVTLSFVLSHRGRGYCHGDSQRARRGAQPLSHGFGVCPSFNSLESLFGKEGLREFGARGMNANVESAPVGFAPLYPPYTLIPASAGMTGYGAAGRCQEFEGVPQLPFFLPPRMGDRGLKTSMEAALL